MTIIHLVSFSTGKDSQATLSVAIDKFGAKKVRAMVLDTDNESEAFQRHIEYIRSHTGVEFAVLKADFSDRMEVHRNRLLAIANGAPDYKKNAKYPWTPESAARAAEVMQPTGNAFLNLCLLKGSFPSHSRQFCTEELKRNVAVEYQLDLVEEGYTVVSWQGVRRDESARRANVAKFEKIGPGMYAYRPIVDWTVENVFSYIKSTGLRPNELYTQGMNRVGCFPCINVNKEELRQIALRFPEEIERIAQWEKLVALASRTGRASFLYSPEGSNIWERVEWAKTSRGGRQYSLLTALEETKACSSAYGLCE